jgi:3-isopropylmalate dehydratase small subunit
MRDHIDTDVIIPSREITSPSREGFGPKLFAPWRYVQPGGAENPDFILNRAPWRHARILIAGRNFGCGSSREMAVWALKQFGIDCVIAPSFGAIFRNNCIRNALLPVELPLERVQELAREAEAGPLHLRVDLQNQQITRMEGEPGRAATAPIPFEFDADDRDMLLTGRDAIDRAWDHRAAIESFEEEDRARRPWAWPDSQDASLPLHGIRVVEFTHMVMGPTCGLVLADLGAEVIKVEPIAGDATRRLLGSGSGFFAAFNRNKHSLAVNMDDPRGREVVLRLLAQADVFSENFKAGALDKWGLSYAALSGLNPRLVYVSHKGFLPGPYEHRTALDEVVQMMGGLAYMTGPEGRPLRAGASVNDIMGGLFGAIGALAALRRRDTTGRGGEVHSALFENNVLLMAQHMMQYAVTGKPASPMPSRISAWAVYDVFTVQDGEQIFLAAVSDSQWAQMCDEFGFDDLKHDARLHSNNDRVRARDWMMPLLRERFAALSAQELARRFEARGLPYAPITKPQALFDDPHLLATGGLAPVQVPADASGAGRALETRTALLPLTIDNQRLPLRSHPPSIGEHSHQVLRDLGYSDHDIETLQQQGVIRAPQETA